MITIVHLITGLETGGAERMLYRLVARIDPDRFRSRSWHRLFDPDTPRKR